MSAPVLSSTSPQSMTAGTAAAIVVTVLAWASAFPAIRAGLASFGAAELGALRFTIAAAPAALFLLITRPAIPSLGDSLRIAFGGLVHVALYTVLLNTGEKTVSAGAASFIINVNPIITAALAMIFIGERFGPMAWLGTALSFAGVGLIAYGEGGGLSFSADALIILAAASCQSVTSIVQKPVFKRVSSLTVTAWMMIVGALALSFALPNALVQARAASPSGLYAAIYLGIVPSLIAYATWMVMLSRLTASRASNFMYCVPPVATLIGFVWLGETPGFYALLGGALALAGVIIVNLRK